VAEWDLVFQIIPEADIEKFGLIAFDGTAVWPTNLTTNVVAGRLVLNEFVKDQHSESELACFCPGHLCPGIEVS
jgi:catalase